MYIKLHSDDKIALKMFEDANFKFVEKHVSEPSLCCPELPPTITYDVSINNSKELEKLFILLDLTSDSDKIDFLFDKSLRILYKMYTTVYENISELKDDIKLLSSGKKEELLTSVYLTTRLEIGDQTYTIRIVSIKISSLSKAIRNKLIKIIKNRQKKLIACKQKEYTQMQQYLNEI